MKRAIEKQEHLDPRRDQQPPAGLRQGGDEREENEPENENTGSHDPKQGHKRDQGQPGMGIKSENLDQDQIALGDRPR